MGQSQWGESEVLEKDVSEKKNRPQSGTEDGGTRMAQAVTQQVLGSMVTWATVMTRSYLFIPCLYDPVEMKYFIKLSSLTVRYTF